MIRTLLLAATAAVVVAGPAAAQNWDWHGGGRGDARAYRLDGPGVRMLLPELRDSRRGQAFVLRNFDRDHDGFITPREANAANRAFIAIAGERRDRFDWEARDRGGDVRPGDRVVVVEQDIAPLPREFRAWHPRQTRYGATIDFGDVLFDTDSARLRPAAADRVARLLGFLRAHPRIRVRIDGYTDSRASQAHNQALSEARATSVARALGVGGARAEIAGHGENDPVSTNATPQGRQQNRRVEVTLVGQRADRFAN